MFSGDGQRRWQKSLGNVWHVTAGDLDGDGTPEVVSTSAAGRVHVFGPDGEDRATLDAGVYANMVRSFRLPAGSADGMLVIGSGAAGAGAKMVAMNGQGERLWLADLPAGVVHCDSLAVSPDSKWAAAGCRGGTVCVVELSTGKIIGTAAEQGLTPQVAWASAGDSPILLVATGRALDEWRVKPPAD